MISKGFVTQTAFKKHLDGDWRTVHELWSHVRNYMTSYPAPADTTYTKTEIDAFFEGYSGGKAQVDAGNVVGLTQGSIPFADASGFLTEDNSSLFFDDTKNTLGIGTTSFGANMVLGIQIKTGTAPTGNVADTFAFYSADFAAGNACPYFRTENGTVIGLNQSLLTTDSPVFAGLTITDILWWDTGDHNLVWGVGAGANLTAGQGTYNLLIGESAGASLTTADNVFCLGPGAGEYADTESNCIYIGLNSGQGGGAGQGGTWNIGIGVHSLKNINGASNNTAMGGYSGLGCATGDRNFFLGYGTGYTADMNDCVSIGYYACYYPTSAKHVIIGSYAGRGAVGANASNDVLIGYASGYALTGGSYYNVGVGSYTLYNLNAGVGNVAMGERSGEGITSGDYNVCIGYYAGRTQITTQSHKLYISNTDTATPLIYGEFDNALLKIFGTLEVADSTIADDGRGLSSIHTLSANPAKSDGIGFYSEGHIGAITTDGPTYGAGIWLNIDAGATLGADVRALDIGIYEAGADCSGGNAYGLAIHMEFDDTDPPAAIYPFRINCNDTAGHATPDALIFAPNRSAIALTDAAPGTADAYLKIVLQDGSVYRIPLVKE